jgi:hypothetical protein
MLPFKLSSLGKPRHPIPRQGCCCRVVLSARFPPTSALVRLPNLSIPAQGAPVPPKARGFSFQTFAQLTLLDQVGEDVALDRLSTNNRTAGSSTTRLPGSRVV